MDHLLEKGSQKVPVGGSVRWARFRKVSVFLGTAPTERFAGRFPCMLLEMLMIFDFDKGDKFGYVLVES
jgi:hypothetical protein